MGNKTQHRIEILADVKTQLTGMDKTISTFQKQLREGTTKIDMTKGLGKDLSKLLSRYAEQSSKIKQMLPGEGNLLDPNDIKDFQKAGNDITKVIREIQRVAGDLGTKELIDAKKLFPSAFDARVDDLLSNLKQIGSSFSTLASEETKLTKVTNEVTNLTNEIQELKNAAQNLDALNQEAASAKAEFDQAKTAVDNFKKSLLDAAKAKLDAKNIENISNKIAELEEKKKAFQDKGYTEKGGKARTKDDLGITDVQKSLKGLTGEERERQKTIIEELQSYNDVLASLREQRAEMEKIVELKKLANSDGEIDITDEKATKKLASAMGQGDNARDLLKAQKQAAEKATAAQTKAQIAGNASEIIPIKEAELQRKAQQVTELTAKIKALKTSADFSSISAKVKELTGLDISKEMLESTKGIEKITEAVSKIQTDEFEALQDGKEGFEGLEHEINGANDSITRFTTLKNKQNNYRDKFQISSPSIILFSCSSVQYSMQLIQ